jgi:hypothetical protein
MAAVCPCRWIIKGKLTVRSVQWAGRTPKECDSKILTCGEIGSPESSTALGVSRSAKPEEFPDYAAFMSRELFAAAARAAEAVGPAGAFQRRPASGLRSVARHELRHRHALLKLHPIPCHCRSPHRGPNGDEYQPPTGSQREPCGRSCVIRKSLGRCLWPDALA